MNSNLYRDIIESRNLHYVGDATTDVVSRYSPEEIRTTISKLVAEDRQDLAYSLSQAGLALYPDSEDVLAIAGLLAAGATVTCLDQPYGGPDATSVRVLREFLEDAADHPSRTWVVADYEADPRLPWGQVIQLP